jgi:hypothetical protein
MGIQLYIGTDFSERIARQQLGKHVPTRKNRSSVFRARQQPAGQWIG